jgi:tRNA-dihydrouridine synthase
MANVTDAAFRRIIAKYSKYGGRDIGEGSKENLPADLSAVALAKAGARKSIGGPDVMWTEFVSCDGLQSPGQKELLVDFMYSEAERPIVAQIFGSKPDNFYKTALLIQELGFDGIDINMGCPDKNVLKQGAGGALIDNPVLAEKIITETKRGAGKLPVSIKTRLGRTKPVIKDWLPRLLTTGLAAVTLHARTCREMSGVPARWEEVVEAVKIRDRLESGTDKTLIIGNGDVQNLDEAKQKIAATGCDGVMIGRGIFGNPWLFNRERDWRLVTTEEKLRVMIEHTYLYEQLLGNHKSFNLMKKHYKAYVSGWDGAKELRVALMEQAATAADVERVVRQHFPGL